MAARLGLFSLIALVGCGKPLPPPPAAADPIPVTGKVVKLDAIEDHRYLQYAVATHVDAPPAAVWEVLTDAPAYTAWNSTIASLEGPIEPGGTVTLSVHISPDRSFALSVTEFEPPKRLVWQDGNRMFKGVRTFTLTPSGEGTDFEMKEVMTGAMIGWIAPKLPDFGPDFEAFAADLAVEAERRHGAGG